MRRKFWAFSLILGAAVMAACGEDGDSGKDVVVDPKPAGCALTAPVCVGNEYRFCDSDKGVDSAIVCGSGAFGDMPLCDRDVGCVAECEASARDCAGDQPRVCVHGGWQNDGAACEHGCEAGACVDEKPSCSLSEPVCEGNRWRYCDAKRAQESAVSCGEGAYVDMPLCDKDRGCVRECETGTKQCDGDVAKVCDGGDWKAANDGRPCEFGCDPDTGSCLTTLCTVTEPFCIGDEWHYCDKETSRDGVARCGEGAFGDMPFCNEALGCRAECEDRASGCQGRQSVVCEHGRWVAKGPECQYGCVKETGKCGDVRSDCTISTPWCEGSSWHYCNNSRDAVRTCGKGEDSNRPVCDDENGCMPECTAGAKTCLGDQPMMCVDGQWSKDGDVCAFLCDDKTGSCTASSLMPCLTYRDFGAKGDGVTNDSDAIVKTHAAANEQHRCVQADSGATYYIGTIHQTAVIKTDTDWRGARFIIDDSVIGQADVSNVTGGAAREDWVFVVDSDKAQGWTVIDTSPDIGKVDRGTQSVGFTLPEDAVLLMFDANKYRYIREGQNANEGTMQQEVIVVNKLGDVQPETPIIWDYEHVTHIYTKYIDDTVLTIKGGEFTTKANQAPSEYTYYNRGISVQRSNVNIDGMKHYISDEGSHGAPYNAFLYITQNANTVVQNAVFTGHKTYLKGGFSTNQMGSYDIGMNNAANVLFKNCSQSNDIDDVMHWGIMGSNFCKNITLNGCKLSRFDAHQGVVGVTIEDSSIGWQGIQAIGEGELNVVNSLVSGTYLVNLREDYGSSWRGKINIINSTFAPTLISLGSSIIKDASIGISIIGGKNTGRHDFGYDCYMPDVEIDGLYVSEKNIESIVSKTTYPGTSVFSDFTPGNDGSYIYTYSYHLPMMVKYRNFTSSLSGNKLTISPNSEMFKETQFIERTTD